MRRLVTPDIWISLGLFFLVCVSGGLLASGIGPAWDEPDNIVAGGQYGTFFGRGLDPSVLVSRDKTDSLFGETVYTQEPSLARYPPVPNYVGTMVAVAGQRLGLITDAHGIIVAFHLATVFFFAVLVVTVYRFGRLLGLTQITSMFAGFAAFLYPTLFGHGLSNLKDTAQVSLFTVSIYMLVRAAPDAVPLIAAGALAWGLGFATKINAIYVPVIWGAWAFGSIVLRKKAKTGWLMGFFYGTAFIILGALVAFTVWPYLWFDPVGRTGEVLQYFTTVGQGYKAFFNGTLYQVGSGQSLWWYPWGNLVLVTPVPLLITAVIGAVSIVDDIRRRKDLVSVRRGILLLWLVLPMLRAIMPSAAFYDGMRHFMEVLPAWILLAAVGLTRLGHVPYLKGNRMWQYSVPPLVILHMAFINTTLFPYSTGYLNMLARDPNVRYDRDIEALSVKEGIEYVRSRYGAGSVWSPIGGHLSWYYLGPGDRYVYRAADADSILLVNKSSHIRQPEFEALIAPTHTRVHTLKRAGVIVGWVYRKKTL